MDLPWILAFFLPFLTLTGLTGGWINFSDSELAVTISSTPEPGMGVAPMKISGFW